MMPATSDTSEHRTVSGPDIQCPWCQSENHRVASAFGGSVSEVLMQCNDCKASFGWMKWNAKASKPGSGNNIQNTSKGTEQ